MTSRRKRNHTLIPDKSIYKKSVLNNGVRVVSEYIPTVRSVSVGLWVGIGSRYENKSNLGISHFLEHMVFKGTRRRNMHQIARSIESIGGYLNAFTTKEHTCFYVRVLDEHLDRAADVITDLVKEPVFRKNHIQNEKNVVLEELKQTEDDPEEYVHDQLEKLLYDPHPLAEPIIGRKESISGFGREDLLHHLESFYTPRNMVLAAAGNVNHTDLVALAEKHLSALKREGRKRIGRPIPEREGRREEIVRHIQQAHVCMGTRSYDLYSNYRYPLIVLNSLLGEGMSSRLNRTIREKHGLAYSIFSFTGFLKDTGMFGIYAGTDADKVDKLIELIEKEFERLREKPVFKAELSRIVSHIKGNTMLGLENMSARMMRLGTGEMYFKKYTSLDEILSKIDNVTVEDINFVANDLLKPENFSTVIIKPVR